MIIVCGVVGLTTSMVCFEAWRVSRAEKMCSHLDAAFGRYLDFYGQFPDFGTEEGADTRLDTYDHLLLVGLLALGDDSMAMNPLGKWCFYTDKPLHNRIPREVDIIDGKLRLSDPWGRPYQIALDTNADGFVEAPTASGGMTRLDKRAHVWFE